jgi:hypothetical protein
MAALLVLGSAIGRGVAQPPIDRDAPPREESSWRHAELHARYAVNRLRLAEARLEKAERLNAISAGQISETDLRALRARVGLLREQVDETRGAPHGYGFNVQRTAAQAAVRLAEQDLAAAVAVNGRKPDAISPIDVRILQLRLDVARLRAEVWDDPAFLASPVDVLQMQIDQLADQMQDMAHRVDGAPTIDRR